jgi:hypothetical protein
LNLLRQLNRARNRNADVIQAVYDAIQTAASGLMIPRVPAPKRPRTKSAHSAEKAIIVVSDLQLAKVTPTYNSDICEQRMERYAEAILRITEIQRSDHPVNDARIYILGDVIEGELIFPHQAYQIDSGLFTQLAIDAPRILINFIRKLLTSFRQIHLMCVPGNHGELGGSMRRAYNPESNADRMLYRYIQVALADEPRLSWQISYGRNESAWYAVDYPFGKNSFGNFGFHGQQIPNPGSASTGTIARRIWGYSSGAIAEPFQNVFFGHWHTPKYIPLNQIEVFCNGSVESTNIYAQERLSTIGQPIQLLVFQHPKRNITAQYWVKLEDNPVVAQQTYDLPKPEIYPPSPAPKLQGHHRPRPRPYSHSQR